MSNYIERYWRDATPADAIKEPPMVARFRQEDEGWVKCSLLYGYDRTREYRWSTKWSDSIGNEFPQCFKHCQVYDAPDPGEGWRLIDTAREEPQDGDEIYDPSTRQWTKRLSPFTANVLSLNRRRITPAVTYVPFVWEDREQLRGRWVRFIENGKECEMICDRFARQVGENGLAILHRGADWLCSNAIFLDTGKPVGKEVTQ